MPNIERNTFMNYHRWGFKNSKRLFIFSISTSVVTRIFLYDNDYFDVELKTQILNSTITYLISTKRILMTRYSVTLDNNSPPWPGKIYKSHGIKYVLLEYFNNYFAAI